MVSMKLPSMENVNSEFRTKLKNLLTKFKYIFEGNGKLKDFKILIAQRLRHFLYHTRRAVKEEIKRLEHLDIFEKVEGPQDWISNLVVVPNNNGKVR